MMKRLGIGIVTAIIAFGISTATSQTNPLTISGYVEAYYGYDFGKPADNLRPPFTYNYNRNNEVNLNLGFLKAAYSTENVRANLGLMVGTYAQYNLAAESDVFRNVYEANAGVKLSKNSNLWLDAGIFAAHIGWEGVIGKDNWTLTRSIAADNSPYYEAGVKISFLSENSEWLFTGLILNGWQRIQRVNNNRSAAFGTQITYKPSASITLNSSTFFGNDKPHQIRQNRYFHNFYSIFQMSEKVGLILGFDAGIEQTSKGARDYNTWYSPTAILRYQPSSKISMAGRGEYYSDQDGVIVQSGTLNGFKTWGYSLNIDYSPQPNIMFRLEGKTYDSKDAIFSDKSGRSTDMNSAITTAVAVSF